MHSERRRHVRKRVDLEVRVVRAEGEPLTAHGSDMSAGGMFMESVVLLPVATPVEVTFRVPTSRNDMTVRAIVRWTTPTGMGVQFQTLGARETYAVTEYLAKCEAIDPPPSTR